MSSLSDKVKGINITLPERLLTKIDAAAEVGGASRSGFLAEAAREYIARHSPVNRRYDQVLCLKTYCFDVYIRNEP